MERREKEAGVKAFLEREMESLLRFALLWPEFVEFYLLLSLLISHRRDKERQMTFFGEEREKSEN